MEQLNLLELAKQGEPTAIASLMNAVLSPKGITARARMDQTCLYIFLESQKGLNQETLITFIQRGLLELGTESIHSVRLQARKSGDEAITWAREFSLQPTPTIVTFPPIEASAKERDAERDQKSEVAIEEELLPASVATLTPLGELIEQLDEASEATIAEESGQESPSSAVAISLPAIDLIELPDEASEAEIEEFEEEALSFRGWLKTRWRTYAIPVALVVVGGFVVGGTTAFWSTSQSQGSVEAGVKPHQDVPEVKQQEAEAYLKAMLAAQENFYRQHGRFARSLEELERSTNLISQSYSYAYRLQVGTDSVITAVSRETDLKSYVGSVIVTPSGTLSALCQSLKPSVQAPAKPKLAKTSQKLVCPARSQKL